MFPAVFFFILNPDNCCARRTTVKYTGRGGAQPDCLQSAGRLDLKAKFQPVSFSDAVQIGRFKRRFIQDYKKSDFFCQRGKYRQDCLRGPKMRYDGGSSLLQVVPSGIPPFRCMFLQPDQFSQGHGGEKEEADGLSYSGIRGERLRITLKETLSSLRINPADEIW